jgi:hypothetical protein
MIWLVSSWWSGVPFPDDWDGTKDPEYWHVQVSGEPAVAKRGKKRRCARIHTRRNKVCGAWFRNRRIHAVCDEAEREIEEAICGSWTLPHDQVKIKQNGGSVSVTLRRTNGVWRSLMRSFNWGNRFNLNIITSFYCKYDTQWNGMKTLMDVNISTEFTNRPSYVVVGPHGAHHEVEDV